MTTVPHRTRVLRCRSRRLQRDRDVGRLRRGRGVRVQRLIHDGRRLNRTIRPDASDDEKNPADELADTGDRKAGGSAVEFAIVGEAIAGIVVTGVISAGRPRANKSPADDGEDEGGDEEGYRPPFGH